MNGKQVALVFTIVMIVLTLVDAVLRTRSASHAESGVVSPQGPTRQGGGTP